MEDPGVRGDLGLLELLGLPGFENDFGLADEGDPGAPPPEAPLSEAQPAVSPPADTFRVGWGQGDVGPAGGRVHGKAGVSMRIPAGALSGTTPMTVTPAPAPGTLPHTRFALVAEPIEVGPSGTRFARPVDLRIPVVLPEDFPFVARDELAVWTSSRGGPWERLPTRVQGAGRRFVLTATTRHLSTFVAGLTLPAGEVPGVTLGQDGRVDDYSGGFGTDAAREAGVDRPGALAVDSAGNLYFGNGGGTTQARPILRMSPDGGFSASDPVADPDGMVVDSADRVIVGGAGRLVLVDSFDANGLGHRVLLAGFQNLNDLAIHRTGDLATDVLYAAEDNGDVWKVTGLDGGLDGTPARTLAFARKSGLTARPEAAVAVDPGTGDLYVVLRNQGNLYRVTPQGVETLLGNWGTVRVNRIAVSPAGLVYGSAYFWEGTVGRAWIVSYNPATGELAGVVTGLEDNLHHPDGLALDVGGKLYVGMPLAGRVMRVVTDPAGQGDPADPDAAIPAESLAFLTQPGSATAGAAILPAVQVEARDAFGEVVPGYTGTITLALGANPAGGTLTGALTQAAVLGVASFPDLAVDRIGTGYTLVATAEDLDSATSDPLDVTPLRVTAFGSDKVRVQVGATATLGWTLEGTPTVLTLDPGAEDVLGLAQTSVTPFPMAPTGVDPRQYYKLTANTPAVQGEQVELDWVRRAGGTGSDIGTAVAALPDGGTVVTGRFEGTASFEDATLTSAGSTDMFLARYRADGSLAWVRQAGASDSGAGRGVAVFPDGGVVVTGAFWGMASFDGTTITNAGDNADMFLARYHADGSLAWVRQAGGTGYDTGAGVAAFPDGGIVVTGFFEGTVSFGDTALASAGDYDVFLARYHEDGSLAWVRRAGGIGPDAGNAVAALPDGSTVVTGSFEGMSSFEGTTLTSAGGNDIFLARYHADGSLAWVRQAGASGSGAGRAVAAFPDGSTVVAGTFHGTVSFEGINLTSAGWSDVFLARYHADGTLAWVRQAGGGGIASDEARGVVALSDGSTLATGSFAGTASFGDTTITSAGSYDMFLARYHADGSLAWVRQAGWTGSEIGNAVAAFPDGSVVVTGTISGTGSFEGTDLTSAGSYDMFLARYQPTNYRMVEVRPEGLAWARQAGGAGEDQGNAVAAFPDGSTVVTGVFSGTASFDGTDLTSAGVWDMFLARYHADGSLAWVRRAGGKGYDTGYGVAAFPDGSVVVTGSFQRTASFGDTTLTSAGSTDMFLARYHADGGLAWVRQAGWSGDDTGSGVAAFPDGSVVVTGFFWGTVSFEDTTLTSAGGRNMFLARYRVDGTLAWVRQAGGTKYGGGSAVAVFPDGSIAVAGAFRGTASFEGTIITSAGDLDMFLARYRVDGTLAWARQAGGGGEDRGNSVAAFPDGSVVVTGTFGGRASFEGTILTSAGYNDIFLARYRADGSLAWAQRAGGVGWDQGQAVAAFLDGSAVVSGYFSGTVSFEDTTLTSAGGPDVFLVRYRADGTLAWVRQAGGWNTDIGNGVAAFPDGSVVVTGWFRDAANFGPGEANENSLTPGGFLPDIFLAKYFPYND